MKYALEIITVIVIVAFSALFVIQNAHIQNTLQPGEEAWSGADSTVPHRSSNRQVIHRDSIQSGNPQARKSKHYFSVFKQRWVHLSLDTFSGTTVGEKKATDCSVTILTDMGISSLKQLVLFIIHDYSQNIPILLFC